MLKAIQNDHEDELKHHLISQGSFFSNVIEKSLSKVIPLWSTAQRHLPKSILNFSIRYLSNSLPNRTNVTNWGTSPISDCTFYLQLESFLHVVADCKKYLEEGRYTRPFFNIQTTGEISPAGPIPSPVATGKIRKIPQLFGPTR